MESQQTVSAAMKLKDIYLLLGRKAMTNLDSILKSRDITLLTKVRLVKAMVFPVVMYGCESWTTKKAEHQNWSFWTVVLEKTLESLLDCKEIQPVHSKGNQFWIFIARTDIEAETPILWPHDAKNWLIGKDPDAGKDWRWEEKGTTEDEMVGWHHQLNGHEFEQAPGGSEGQGSLGCCSPWVTKSQTWATELKTWKKYYGQTSRVSLWSESESRSVVSNSLRSPGILQARILEWVAFPFSRRSSQPRDRTPVFHIAGRFFTNWATREAQEYCSGWPSEDFNALKLLTELPPVWSSTHLYE